MSRRVRIGTPEDFPEGTLVPVDAEGLGIVVARQGDTLCAARNRCPHVGLSLTTGPGGIHFDDGVVRCPWHNSHFVLCSGENVDWTPGIAGRELPKWSQRALSLGRKPAPLTTYPVVVEDGAVYVEV